MTPLSHDETRELLGAFALDAVEPDEASHIEAHLITCPRCRDEVREHREVAALLAYSGTSAPEGMWDRLVANLEAPPPASEAPALGLMRGGQAAAGAAGRRRRRPRIVAAVAAAAMVSGLGAGGLQVQSALSNQDRELKRMQEALVQADARGRIGREAVAAALAGGARQVHLLTPDRAPLADAVVLDDGSGYLVDVGAPTLPEGQTYQLWAVAGGQKLSLAIPGREFDVLSFRVPEATDALAVTVETAPGVVISQNQAVAFGLVQS